MENSAVAAGVAMLVAEACTEGAATAAAAVAEEMRTATRSTHILGRVATLTEVGA